MNLIDEFEKLFKAMEICDTLSREIEIHYFLNYWTSPRRGIKIGEKAVKITQSKLKLVTYSQSQIETAYKLALADYFRIQDNLIKQLKNANNTRFTN